ncbi:hypothetical protein [Microlunatus soli]|uniref:Uncharacterized protein n=1 Tax=Microlunatus soli TaxID=630515 RepID=A0A1H1PS67_9ACTN|nr:hypothetical protein [Microlunatus soli]SDS13964.1 hypothetical protein SAMN04489812_1003 [Microlunatus soli]
MSWHWQSHLRSGAGPVDTAELGLDQRFPTQGDAESWLGEVYPDLLQAGVEAVSLYEADRLVYGPMRLEPEVG